MFAHDYYCFDYYCFKKKKCTISVVTSVLDALDYTEKWLKDTVTDLREARAEGSSGASLETPSHLSLNVHNHAYVRLLAWDHGSDPFPEVKPPRRSALLTRFV